MSIESGLQYRERTTEESMNKLVRKQDAILAAPEYFEKELAGWSGLKPDEQKTVVSQTQALAGELINEGRSKLQQGQHLAAIRAILKPKQMWMGYLKSLGRVNPRTADRYINTWEALAKRELPPPAVEYLLGQGLDIVGQDKKAPLGAYTMAFEKHPEPKGNTKTAYKEWTENLRSVANQIKGGRGPRKPDPEVTNESLMKEVFQFFRVCYRKLPSDSHKAKARWINELTGMMLSQLGVSNPQTIKPIAAPEDFLRGPGRPPINTEESAAS